MCVSGGKNVSFSENFAYVLNEWPLTQNKLLLSEFQADTQQKPTKRHSQWLKLVYSQWKQKQAMSTDVRIQQKRDQTIRISYCWLSFRQTPNKSQQKDTHNDLNLLIVNGNNNRKCLDVRIQQKRNQTTDIDLVVARCCCSFFTDDLDNKLKFLKTITLI